MKRARSNPRLCEARRKLARIVLEDLPKVRTKTKISSSGRRVIVKATKKDERLSRRISLQMNMLMRIISEET